MKNIKSYSAYRFTVIVISDQNHFGTKNDMVLQ